MEEEEVEEASRVERIIKAAPVSASASGTAAAASDDAPAAPPGPVPNPTPTAGGEGGAPTDEDGWDAAEPAAASPGGGTRTAMRRINMAGCCGNQQQHPPHPNQPSTTATYARIEPR